ncbi:MAG: hypothetical protein U9O94_10100 [Nanoarchaeota archaeon]|nr:hypothetical protein [Nanoarchaeota archaeon]
MVPISQIEYLMDDLKTIDDFFIGHGYHRLGKSVKSRGNGLQIGFDVLKRCLFAPEFPALLYNPTLTYGEEALPDHGSQQFFVSVEIWNLINRYDYSYSITIRLFPDKVDQPSDVERLDRYFRIPPEHRREQPLQKMLKELEKLL